jgi:hypothetical protein
MRGRVFARLFGSDLRYGLRTVAPRLLAVLVASVFVYFFSYVRMRVYLPAMEGPLTWGENLLCVWRGMLPYEPQLGEPFTFPMHWFALLAIVAYVTLDYPFRDLNGFGGTLVVASRSRWSWWLAKCGWTVVCAVVCWAVPLVLCALVTAGTRGAWTLGARPSVVAVLDAGRNAAVTEAGGQVLETRGADVGAELASFDLLPAVCVLLAALVAILLIQLAASLMVRPILGFFIAVAVLFFSAFFTVWWLPGEYLMLARCDVLCSGGMQAAVGAALCLWLSALCVVVGGVMFNHKDLMGRGTDGL